MWLMTVFGASALLLAANRRLRPDGRNRSSAHQAIGIRPRARSTGSACQEHGGLPGDAAGLLLEWCSGSAPRSGWRAHHLTFLFGVTPRDPVVFVGVAGAVDRRRVRGGLGARAPRERVDRSSRSYE